MALVLKKKFQMKNAWVSLLCIVVIACNSNSELEKKISNIPVDVTIDRFDKVFAEATFEDLSELKQTYPQFFPVQYADSIWEFRMQDTLQQQLSDAVLTAFPSEEKLAEDLAYLFQHIKYYFPEFTVPIVYTTTSDVEYRTKAIATKNELVIALDTYLGSDHPFYEGIPKYISKNLERSQLLPDVASAYAPRFIVPSNDRSFLSQMIYYGKELYLKDLWLPKFSDAEKIGYTEDELMWAEANEAQIWSYFIENETLYSTSPKLLQRFITPAPFSKFNLEIDNQSPGRIGQWVGWQIVRSYMENNPVSVGQLMSVSPKDIYENSNYKPQK